MAKTRSYYVSYWATDGGALLGGIARADSCRYQLKSEAQLRLQIVRETNGPDRCDGLVRTSAKYPEIFRHCGKYSTAIGCHCPGCGKVLTLQDACATVRMRVPRKRA